MIARNLGVCLSCGDIIESTHVHDMAWCGCGASFVDGGREYTRAGGNVVTCTTMDEAVRRSSTVALGAHA